MDPLGPLVCLQTSLLGLKSKAAYTRRVVYLRRFNARDTYAMHGWNRKFQLGALVFGMCISCAVSCIYVDPRHAARIHLQCLLYGSDVAASSFCLLGCVFIQRSCACSAHVVHTCPQLLRLFRPWQFIDPIVRCNSSSGVGLCALMLPKRLHLGRQWITLCASSWAVRTPTCPRMYFPTS